jgi:hypothetical protein
VQVTLDGSARGCATYEPLRDRFIYTLKTDKNTTVGTHMVGIRVTAPDGSGVINNNSVPVVIKK